MSKSRKKRAPARRSVAAKPADEARSPHRAVVSLAIAGMLITAYLTAVHWLGDNPLLCGEGSGCDVIQQSRWSTLLGLPMALWGFLLYLAIGLMAWRMPDRLKRWRRLFAVALTGTAISIYLTVVGIVSLDAVCLWCLASLAIMSAILAAVTVRRHGSAPGMSWRRWLTNNAGAAAIVVALLHLWHLGLLAHPDTPRLEALAVALDERGARFYGAWWCPACQAQKEAFRGAADRLPYVECSSGGRGSPMTLACRDLGIRDYPTWIIDGRHYPGVLEPRELARRAGVEWD